NELTGYSCRRGEIRETISDTREDTPPGVTVFAFYSARLYFKHKTTPLSNKQISFKFYILRIATHTFSLTLKGDSNFSQCPLF
ncbi:hypothetical protein KA005_57855, partial [bacterium]|nr:hypothetical protein [bacterium]